MFALLQHNVERLISETFDIIFFYGLLTVHLSISILVINQLDAQDFVLQ